MTKNTYTFADCFAGIGGFHLGFHNAGAECVLACEWDKYARKVYKENFKSISPELFENDNYETDISLMNHNFIPDFDILCGGFPCTSFSIMGNRRGFEEENKGAGVMFFEMLKLLKNKKPKAFFMENVDELLKNNEGKSFQAIKHQIEKAGYSFHFEIFRGTDFNVPQIRKRVFMVGFRGETTKQSTFKFPEPVPFTYKLKDLLGVKHCEREACKTILTGGASNDINDHRNWSMMRIVDHNNQNKIYKLTIDDMRKLFGFPNGFNQSMVSNAQAAKQWGNCVILPAISATAKKVVEYLDKLQGKEEVMG